MPEPVLRGATYDDLLKVPDHLVAEIVEGELFTSPRPAVPHTRANSALGGWLFSLFDTGTGGPGGWWILIEPELHLGSDVLVPDIAGWRRQRVPYLPRTAAIEIAPDWICEVVSPATGGLDRLRKVPRYALHGVAHAWIVDPEARGLEVYRLEGEHFSLIATHEGEETIHAEPFEGAALELGNLWLPTPPSPQSSR